MSQTRVTLSSERCPIRMHTLQVQNANSTEMQVVDVLFTMCSQDNNVFAKASNTNNLKQLAKCA